jgi:hypothetical protein
MKSREDETFHAIPLPSFSGGVESVVIGSR